jgi:hypothetical protein
MAAMVLGPSCVLHRDRAVTVDADASVGSSYVFRGQTMVDGPVAQGNARVGLPLALGGAVQLAGFANVDLTNDVGGGWFDDGHAGEITEYDGIAAYAFDAGPLTVEAGAQYYGWPDGLDFPASPFPSTTQAFVRVGADVAGFAPSVTVFRDVDEVNGADYAQAGLAREVLLAKALRLELGGSLGWSDATHSLWLYRRETDGFSDLAGRAHVAWDARDWLTVRVGAHASTILDDTMRGWFDGKANDADVVWFTLGVAVAF